VRAVNLIPAETRRSTLDAQSLRGPGPAVIGLLVVAVILVTMYVLASNSISQHRAELSTLRQELAQTQATSGSLTAYSQFAQLAQVRAETVQEIAASRFDWAKAMSDLSKVVPGNTTLESLNATVDPAASAGGAGSSGGSLRADIATPAFELAGCTATQDDVARLMSRLRVIPDVVRVTLSDSVESDAASTGASVAGTGGGCGSTAPTFDLVVFFQPPASPPVTTTPASASGATTPTTGTTAPAAATAPSSSSAPAATIPASGTTGGAP